MKKIAVGFALLAMSNAAMAGSAVGGDFNEIYTTVTNWLNGEIGIIMALLIFAVGLGIGILKQSLASIVLGVGGALAAANAVSVIENIFGAGMPVVNAAAVAAMQLPII